MSGSRDPLTVLQPPLDQPTDAVGLARIPHQPDRAISCRRCGSTSSAHSARLTGSWAVTDGSPVWECAGCTREHLAEIELHQTW